MKAIITTTYGPPEVLQIVDVNKPVPGKNEVLVKVKAIAVTSGDCRMRAFNPPFRYFRIPMRLSLGICKPRKPIQGLWLSGQVVEIGTEVKKIDMSQQVYARTPDLKFGANAEYVCLPENCIIGLKPKNLSYEEAVSIPFGALTALYFLKKARIRQGDKVLVYGASGSVGIAAVQLGKYLGAEIYGVCSTGNLELVISNGADHVIDYTKQSIEEISTRFDIIFDAVGKLHKSVARRLLNKTGSFISVFTSGHAQGGSGELDYITKLAEAGILTPVIDKCYPFEQLVDAHRYVDNGHKKGNVVISATDN